MKTETDSPARTHTMNVLIADKFEASGIAGLEMLGCRVEFQPDLGPDTLPAAVAEHAPQILLVRSTKVPAAAIEASPALALVIRAGAGYDSIDLESASAHGVFVANCPGKNALAVAELAWGLILGCDRRLPDQTADLRAGRWDKRGYAKGARGLCGRTLGIVGLGTIGAAIAERGRAFGMRPIVWSRSLTPERAEQLGYAYCASPLDVAQSADVVSVSVASTPDTEHLINADFLNAMRDSAIFVNTSRGAVVDETALVNAIRTKGLRCGLDVWGQQPGPSDSAFANPLIHEPGVYGSHHCGASTDQAQQAIADEAVRIARVFIESGEVPNCVNRRETSAASALLTVRHLNRPGVLAHVFQILSGAAINVEEMENIIYDGAHAACARVRIDGVPSPVDLEQIQANDNILSVDLATT